MSDPRRSTIVLGVTSADSHKLLTGFPDFLASRGWHVHVVAAASPPSSGAATYHAVPMTRQPAPLRDLVALVRWVRLLRDIKPDIVVAGTPKAGLLGTLAAAIVRVPARVYLLRGLRLETETGARRKVLWLTEWIAARASTTVQSVSISLRELFVELNLAPDTKVVVVGAGSSNGVDVRGAEPSNAVSHASLGLNPLAPVIGFVGRIHQDKGIDTLLRGLIEARRHVPAAQLLMVGPEERPGAFLAAMTRVGVGPEGVRWVGAVADARPYYGAMTVLCLPTRREGLPNVVLEAAIQGVPAVVSDVTGARDAVVDGITGLLFQLDDVVGLGDQLVRVISHPSYCRDLGVRAQQHVTATFARETVWDRTEEFLTRQVEKARPTTEVARG